MDKRVAVAVRLSVDERGETTPLAIEWPDGRVFEIVRVERRERVVDKSNGEVGWRYDVILTLMSRDETRRLYRFGPVWYVYKRPWGALPRRRSPGGRRLLPPEW